MHGTKSEMAKARQKSVRATGNNAGASASQCLFEVDPLQKPNCAEQSQNMLRTKQGVKRRTKSRATHASDALSLFAAEVSASSSEPVENNAVVAIPLAFRVPIGRVSVVSTKRQRISGIHPITDAAETVCASANAILKALNGHAYPHMEVTAAGVQVEYLLTSLGRSELIRITGLDRKTVRLAMRDLRQRHLIALHAPSEPYQHTREIYRLLDPRAAAETMRTKDGHSGWRQRGRGRVMYSAGDKVLNRE